jgi:ABC-type polysaccharide/polyol phosphate transport system ATPase subunit
MPHIELHDVSLTFRIRRHGQMPFKDYVLQKLTPWRKHANPMVEIHALDHLSLRVDAGERLGIIGGNGAGKSTLLRVLAGIYPPTEGRRSVEGRISSLFDLVQGFNYDATGWENIVLRGYLEGETPRSIGEKKRLVAELSGLREFLDLPVRYYSSGMLVRLGFSIATSIAPEILLLDEVLAAGDLSFRNTAQQRMKDLIHRAQLVVMVSHDLPALRESCTRVIWVERGRICRDGSPDDVIAAYQQQHSPTAQRVAA